MLYKSCIFPSKCCTKVVFYVVYLQKSCTKCSKCGTKVAVLSGTLGSIIHFRTCKSLYGNVFIVIGYICHVKSINEWIIQLKLQKDKKRKKKNAIVSWHETRIAGLVKASIRLACHEWHSVQTVDVNYKERNHLQVQFMTNINWEKSK